MEEQNNDEQFMRRCIELSHKSIKEGGKPFGCLITKNNDLVVEMENQAQDDLTQHAEILAMRETAKNSVLQIFRNVPSILIVNPAQCVPL